MEGFSIDDVRDTIGADVTRFLDRIERAAGTLSDPCAVLEKNDASPLSIIGDAGHAIYGTSSLVRADSLSSTARLIERLAEQGRHELALAMKHLQRVKDIAAATRRGATEMKTMLALELDHQPEDASFLAKEWQSEAHRLLAELAQLAINPEPEPEPSAEADPMMAELHSVFHQEAVELLGSVRLELAALSANAGDLRAARALERHFHTLKGAAAMVGLEAASEAASVLQKRLQAIVDDGTPATSAFVNDLIGDCARLLLEAGLPEVTLAPAAFARHELQAPEPELWAVFEEECGTVLETLERGILALEESAEPAQELAKLLPTYHTLKGIVNTMNLAPTGALVHRVEDALQRLAEAPSLSSTQNIATVLFNVQREIKKNLEQAKDGYVETALASFEQQLATLEPAASEQVEVAPSRTVRVSTDRLDSLMNLAGELVVSRARLLARVEELRAVQLDLGHESKRIIESVETFSEEHEYSLLNKRKAELTAVDEEDFSELELDRYEDINILARTLETQNGVFGEAWKRFAAGLAALTDDSDAFGAIVSGIRSEVTRARMVPLEVLFSQLKLPVRDVAVRESKEVRVSTRGADVHLDKTIADELLQPMLHLVRNAVVHGIESPDARQTMGKPRTGAIELVAREELGQVVLEVRDDGGGLDLAALHQRGVALGLIPPSTPLLDSAVRDLVFEPGLSTEDGASAVAGRGLGCDLVRRAIERLNGSVRIETTSGAGTVFVLTLPVTLAITRALLVKQGAQSYAVPLYFAERILDPQEQEVVDAVGIRRVRINDAYLPITRLSRVFGVESDHARGPMVVLRMGAQRLVVEVDAVLGQEEIVVKSLRAMLSDHALFSGVTVRGTGELVLILDVPALIEARASLRGAPRKALPRSISFVPRTALPATPELVSAIEQTKKPRVLFVDDSLSVRKAAERILRSLNTEVTLAVDGVDALAKIGAASFDIVFTDLEMPRMHGFDLIREVRSRARDLPIVIVTSRATTKHRDQATALGASEYLTKPFTAEALEAALAKWGRGKKLEVV